MIQLLINDEFSYLKQVILGISTDFGGCPNLEDAYDPKSIENIISKSFPKEQDIEDELLFFSNILQKYNVDVLRPRSISKCNQVFARDVGFVLGNRFFISNMIKNRQQEILGLEYILKKIHKSNIISIPSHIFIEGGDVLAGGEYIFVGYSDENDFSNYKVSRTNKSALNFLQSEFPDKKIIGFELKKSDDNSNNNCLHLDCCFQPLGLGHVIVCPDAFKFVKDVEIIEKIFGQNNIIDITKDEMSSMFSNVLSITHNTVVLEKSFRRLHNILKHKGYLVEEVSFSEISKMGGLLRCATLPLVRNYE